MGKLHLLLRLLLLGRFSGVGGGGGGGGFIGGGGKTILHARNFPNKRTKKKKRKREKRDDATDTGRRSAFFLLFLVLALVAHAWSDRQSIFCVGDQRKTPGGGGGDGGGGDFKFDFFFPGYGLLGDKSLAILFSLRKRGKKE